MKFRECAPCPNCGCRCEEYNDETGYIGCPACERKRVTSKSYQEFIKKLIKYYARNASGNYLYDYLIGKQYNFSPPIPLYDSRLKFMFEAMELLNMPIDEICNKFLEQWKKKDTGYWQIWRVVNKYVDELE